MTSKLRAFGEFPLTITHNRKNFGIGIQMKIAKSEKSKRSSLKKPSRSNINKTLTK